MDKLTVVCLNQNKTQNHMNINVQSAWKINWKLKKEKCVRKQRKEWCKAKIYSKKNLTVSNCVYSQIMLTTAQNKPDFLDVDKVYFLVYQSVWSCSARTSGRCCSWWGRWSEAVRLGGSGPDRCWPDPGKPQTQTWLIQVCSWKR